MKKEIYEAPEMEIVEFEGADVIATSGGGACFNWFAEAFPGCSDHFFTIGSGNSDCGDNNHLYDDTGFCSDPTMASNQGHCIFDATIVS